MQCSKEGESMRSCALRQALAALLICAALICIAAPSARSASDALWVADWASQRVDEYVPSQLKRSHKPTPITISIGTYPNGVCFDQSNNLWVTDEDEDILEFTVSALEKLPTTISPAVTVSSSSFQAIHGCTFDKLGNLWLADFANDSLDEISAAQLKAGGGSITPAVIITDTADVMDMPGGVTFDKSGNLWTDGYDDGELFEFSASELTSGGNKTAAAVLMGDGSLSIPGQIGFDGKGNLWVTNYDADTVVMFSENQLGASNNDAPAKTIGSSSLDGPWGLAFNSGHLWVLNYDDGNAQEFSSSQLKKSGARIPKVLLKSAAVDYCWQITFGPAYGKLP